MFLADTNILSELMRPAPHPGVRKWLHDTVGAGSMAISAMTFDEIMYGLTRKPKPQSLLVFDRIAAQSVVVDVTESVARRAGELRALLSMRGQVREQADMLIAATAQVHALTLVTRNVRDFDGCGIAVLNPFEG